MTSTSSTSLPVAGLAESIALLALLSSLTALSIDIVLPALPFIGQQLQLAQINDAQLVVSFLMLGIALGQLMYGPASDSAGRKSLLTAGLLICIGGCWLSYSADSFALMLLGRLVQGFGLAGPRSIVMAIIRDQYTGTAMARIMSSILTVFILVPLVAPALGQLVLARASWRAIFLLLLVLAVLALLWFLLRQPETLPLARRRPFRLQTIASAAGEVCRNRQSLGYTLVSGCILGAFLGYLNSAQQIFQDIYSVGQAFPLYFGFLAMAIGLALLINVRLVGRLGMRVLVQRASWVLTAMASLFWLWSYGRYSGQPPLGQLIVCMLVILFCYGILFGNLSALAMTPLGHIAGTAAAVTGSLSTLISVPLAIGIGRCYDGTVLPLLAGFMLLSMLALLIMRWIGGGVDEGR